MSFFKRCRFFKNLSVLGLLGFHEFRWQWAGPTAGARFGNCSRRRSGFSLVSLLGGCRPRALQIQNLIFVLFRCGCATVRVDVFRAEFERGFSSGVGFQVGTPLPRRSLQRTLTFLLLPTGRFDSEPVGLIPNQSNKVLPTSGSIFLSDPPPRQASRLVGSHLCVAFFDQRCYPDATRTSVGRAVDGTRNEFPRLPLKLAGRPLQDQKNSKRKSDHFNLEG